MRTNIRRYFVQKMTFHLVHAAIDTLWTNPRQASGRRLREECAFDYAQKHPALIVSHHVRRITQRATRRHTERDAPSEARERIKHARMERPVERRRAVDRLRVQRYAEQPAQKGERVRPCEQRELLLGSKDRRRRGGERIERLELGDDGQCKLRLQSGDGAGAAVRVEGDDRVFEALDERRARVEWTFREGGGGRGRPALRGVTEDGGDATSSERREGSYEREKYDVRETGQQLLQRAGRVDMRMLRSLSWMRSIGSVVEAR
jgi:hypothetical protein